MGATAPKVSKGRSESPLVASAEAKPLRQQAQKHQEIRKSTKKTDFALANIHKSGGFISP
jgi:hypothetical protein